MTQQSKLPLNSMFRKSLRAIGAKGYAHGFSLPAAFYTDPAWMQAECDELFLQGWFCVGRVEEVAQACDFFSFDHVGQPILLVHSRDLEGTIRDFYRYLSRNQGSAGKTIKS